MIQIINNQGIMIIANVTIKIMIKMNINNNNNKILISLNSVLSIQNVKKL
jgi:hypothetical protein